MSQYSYITPKELSRIYDIRLSEIYDYIYYDLVEWKIDRYGNTGIKIESLGQLLRE